MVWPTPANIRAIHLMYLPDLSCLIDEPEKFVLFKKHIL